MSLANVLDLDATIAAQNVTVTSGCGRRPTLGVSAAGGRVSLSDGTLLTTSPLSVSLSSPSSTLVGSAICTINEVTCSLADVLSSGGPVNDAINLLVETLNRLVRTLV